MKNLCLMGLLFLIWSCSSDYRYERRYDIGTRYSYKMTSVSKRDIGNPSKVTAYITLEVTRGKDGLPVEKITWDRIANYGTGISYDSVLRNIKPYEISLHPNGSVEMPDVKNPFLAGLIADLNLFFVCLSPKNGIHEVSKAGDTHQKSEAIVGDFSNGSNIAYGKDCLILTHELTAINEEMIIYQSNLEPPATGCDEIALNENTQLSKGQNFIMTRPTAGGRIMLFRGAESYTIKSVTNREDGKLLRAEMTNSLHMEMQTCESDYSTCSPQSPMKMEKNVTLELI